MIQPVVSCVRADAELQKQFVSLSLHLEQTFWEQKSGSFRFKGGNLTSERSAEVVLVTLEVPR